LIEIHAARLPECGGAQGPPALCRVLFFGGAGGTNRPGNALRKSTGSGSELLMPAGGASRDPARAMLSPAAAASRRRTGLVFRPAPASHEPVNPPLPLFFTPATAQALPMFPVINSLSHRDPAISRGARRQPARTAYRRRLLTFLASLAVIVIAPATSAQLASRPAESWIKSLDSPHRVARLKMDETIARLKLNPGDVVADIGAGAGTWTVPLAKAVLPTGKVYAVDIDQGLIDHVALKAAQARLANVETVLGKFTDANLPASDVDVAFIFDVLHHVEDRAGYIENLAPYLKNTGRIAVIDFHPELGPHKNDPALQITREQTNAWMARIGFKPVEEHELFADSWYVIYARGPQISDRGSRP
jgi:ubiquinone/menaquinone biosynthesis C-methylase UbiE